MPVPSQPVRLDALSEFTSLRHHVGIRRRTDVRRFCFLIFLNYDYDWPTIPRHSSVRLTPYVIVVTIGLRSLRFEMASVHSPTSDSLGTEDLLSAIGVAKKLLTLVRSSVFHLRSFSLPKASPMNLLDPLDIQVLG